MPFCLETEVAADALRYRLRRGGSWRTVALSLSGGKKLLLGSAGPERLLAALKTGTGESGTL